MNIVFWNTYKNTNINDILLDLIQSKNIDILILAEYTANITELIYELYIKDLLFNEIKTISCKKIKIICKNGINMQLHDDNTNYASFKITKELLEFQLFATHFPSKMRNSDNNRRIVASQLKNDAEHYEKVIVVGDFNSNPFEETMVSLTGMHALPSKKIKTRTVQGIKKETLYNPMWKFFGDFEDCPGTYYNDNSDDVNYYWHIFDQILISENMIRVFKIDELEIIKKIKEINLIKNKKIDKDISDHLPIYFGLEE